MDDQPGAEFLRTEFREGLHRPGASRHRQRGPEEGRNAHRHQAQGLGYLGAPVGLGEAGQDRQLPDGLLGRRGQGKQELGHAAVFA